jgi:hypothetical protein
VEKELVEVFKGSGLEGDAVLLKRFELLWEGLNE